MNASIDIDLIELCPLRKASGAPKVSVSLLEEVLTQGVLTPITVRPTEQGRGPYTRYEILRGEDIWMAAQKAGINKVPVFVCEDIGDAEAEYILNNQHDILRAENPIAKAEMLMRLLKSKPHYSKAALARDIGKKRSDVSHLLRLLDLSPIVKRMIIEKRITEGHARPLVSLPPMEQEWLAQRVVDERLSVRQTEGEARGSALADQDKPPGTPTVYPVEKDLDVTRLEHNLAAKLGCAASLENGKLIIDYCDNNEILEGVLERLGYEYS